MSIHKLLASVREEFETRLATKTGWGRIELMSAYDQAVQTALAKMLDGMVQE